jgi:phosphatidylserine/phosphatidylglycerophosphate/cardiolipin synthase-like enzyme
MIPAGAEGPTAQSILSLHADSLRGIANGAEERILYFATIGSHNQDRRSMILDGEVLVAISGSAALTTAIDFACLVATATWPRNAAELEAYFPESPGLMARVQRWIQNLI